MFTLKGSETLCDVAVVSKNLLLVVYVTIRIYCMQYWSWLILALFTDISLTESSG